MAKGKGKKPPKAGKAPKPAKGKKPKPAPKASKPKKPKKQKAPSQPAQTDKFGIALLVLVFVMLIANILVWDKAGANVGKTMLNSMTAAEYNSAISPNPKIVAYESRGVLAKMPGEVDVVVFDKGSLHGIHVGDVFRSEKVQPDDNQFIEFCVFEVSDSVSRAWIILGTTWSERASLRLTESILTNIDGLGPGSVVSRSWDAQSVRKLVQPLAEG